MGFWHVYMGIYGGGSLEYWETVGDCEEEGGVSTAASEDCDEEGGVSAT